MACISLIAFPKLMEDKIQDKPEKFRKGESSQEDLPTQGDSVLRKPIIGYMIVDSICSIIVLNLQPPSLFLLRRAVFPCSHNPM